MSELLHFTGFFGQLTHEELASRSPSPLFEFTLPDSSKPPVKSPYAVARAEHGRWIASCPFDGCPGAEFVNFDTGLFFCCHCRNMAVERRYLKVQLPEKEMKEAVEYLLLLRPVPDTRNWYPHESLDILRDENLGHGIGVD